MIEAATNQKVRWFAPPSGSFRDEVVKIADDFQMGTIMWTVDTIDWKRPEPDVLLQRVMRKIHRCYRINASYFVNGRSIRYND